MAPIFKSFVPKRPGAKGAAQAEGGAPRDPVPEKARITEPENDTEPANKQEIGGPEGPEPTRYGDWERGGICTDF